MTIQDNGYTLTRPLGGLKKLGTENYISLQAHCLADLADWLESALAEVKAKIAEDYGD